MECACRVSELRAAELLDDLCEDMHLYTWTAHPDTDALSISEPSTTESSTTAPSSASSDKAQVMTPSELPESDSSAATVDAEESTKTSPSPSPSLVGKTVSNLRVKIHWRWQRTSAVASTVPPEHRASKSELDARRKQLKSFCYGLVERTEERLTTYLAADAQHHEGASCPCWAWVAPDVGICA
jgi:hypothetical protein